METAEWAQNRLYTDRHVKCHFRNTIRADPQTLCHVDSVGHHFHFWSEESRDLPKLDTKPVRCPLSANHLLTCTAATGNFGEVTPARVGNKTKQTPMGRNRNAHQHLPKLFLYVPLLAPAMHFTKIPRGFPVVVFATSFWDLREQRISKTDRALATGGHFCIIKLKSEAGASSPGASLIYFLVTKRPT